MLVCSTNLGIETAPVVVSSAKTLSESQGKVVSSQRTKLRPLVCGTKGLGLFPRLCVGCCSSSLCRTRVCRWKGSWEWANSTPGPSRPQSPTRDWVRAFRIATSPVSQRRETYLSPVQYRFPKASTSRSPGSQTHSLSSSLFSDLSFVKSFQFFLLNQLFCCFF